MHVSFDAPVFRFDASQDLLESEGGRGLPLDFREVVASDGPHHLLHRQPHHALALQLVHFELRSVTGTITSFSASAAG